MEAGMGFKQLVATLAIVLVILLYFVVGSENVSGILQKYAEDKLKDSPDRQEQIMFFNIQYCDFTAKYQAALDYLARYSAKFDKEENRDKALFMKAKIMDDMMQARAAEDAYKAYTDQFPDGKYAAKARRRFDELKSY